MSDPAVLKERLDYLGLDDGDRELLAALRPVLEKHADGFVAAFYRHLLSFGPTRAVLGDPAVKERLLAKQRSYLLSLSHPEFDEAYLDDRRRIGEVHERVGLEPRWYLGAYSLYFSLLAPLVADTYAGDTERSCRTLVAVQKLLTMDAQLAMETYIARRESELEYLAKELAKAGQRLGRDFAEQRVELRETQERARAAEQLASIATLVAGLAHEIGTPMGVIQGHAKMLESNVSGEDGQWRLETIQEQIGRISRIIQTLLNMARPGKDRRVPVALEGLLESTLSFLSEKLGRRQIEVERAFDSVPSVQGDPERLQQLLLNLLLNAADAMPDGGKLRLGLAPTKEGDVEILIADTGAGVPEADLARIFEPFFTTKESGQGNGLGLMVAQGIVKDHGGTIDVTSREGEGTEFRIRLVPPVAPGDADTIAN
jgi:signal transduction histidine kinase